jgi:hypothetical protein
MGVAMLGVEDGAGEGFEFGTGHAARGDVVGEVADVGAVGREDTESDAHLDGEALGIELETAVVDGAEAGLLVEVVAGEGADDDLAVEDDLGVAAAAAALAEGGGGHGKSGSGCQVTGGRGGGIRSITNGTNEEQRRASRMARMGRERRITNDTNEEQRGESRTARMRSGEEYHEWHE